jgi:hypothetical protein
MVTLLTSAGRGGPSAGLLGRGQQQQRGSRSVDANDAAGGPIVDVDSPLPEYDYVVGMYMAQFCFYDYICALFLVKNTFSNQAIKRHLYISMYD